jgi:segregation and condensation protein B|tara:strand:- start:217 stop:801 length:585 start_codon:yes stop_codon:yes gene_type:complete
MAKETPALDTDLEDLPPELRWREWMGRIEAVIFASASPVPRADLARVVGQGASVELLIQDIQVELAGRPYELVAVADGWLMLTQVRFADAIRTAADVGGQLSDLNEFEVAVLASIAYHQPLTRDGLKDIFGKDISRDLMARLRAQELITTGPRSPRAGAPYTYVTTQKFLVVFGMESLRDLPDRDELENAGLAI